MIPHQQVNSLLFALFVFLRRQFRSCLSGFRITDTVCRSTDMLCRAIQSEMKNVTHATKTTHNQTQNPPATLYALRKALGCWELTFAGVPAVRMAIRRFHNHLTCALDAQ